MDLDSTSNVIADVLSAIPQGLLLLDHAGRVKLCNEAAGKALQITPGELLNTQLETLLQEPATLRSVLSRKSNASQLRLVLKAHTAQAETSVLHLPGPEHEGELLLLLLHP